MDNSFAKKFDSGFTGERNTPKRVELALNPKVNLTIEPTSGNSLKVRMQNIGGLEEPIDLQSYLNESSVVIDKKKASISFVEAEPTVGFGATVTSGEVGVPTAGFTDPKQFWELLHEVGHVSAHQRDLEYSPRKAEKSKGAYFQWNPESQKLHKEIEEDAWVRAAEIAEKLYQDLGIDVFSVFTNSQEFVEWVTTHTKKYKELAVRAGSFVRYTTLKEARFKDYLKKVFQRNVLSDLTEEEMEKQLVEIYGERIREEVEYLKTENPGISSKDLIERIQQESTCANSSFFREPNIRVLAEDVIARDKKKNWRILCVGCGQGPEPYELAMRLEQNGSNFHIDGIDARPRTIEAVKRGVIKAHPLGFTDKEKIFFANEKNLFSEESSQHIKLSDRVMSKMDFKVHNIINAPVPVKEKYDIIICNNLLQHFPESTRKRILINILNNLKPGGILTLESERMDTFKEHPRVFKEDIEWLAPYYKWRKTLNQYGLKKRKYKNSENPFEPPTEIFFREQGR